MSEAKLPQFPLSSKPCCRRCGWEPEFRNTVKATNKNGNAGRQYYKCNDCAKKTGQGVGGRLKGWITWDDNRGVDIKNPKCHCKIASRQDRAGACKTRPNLGFWTCATGSCSYYSAAKNGQTVEQRKGNPNMAGYREFRPWLL